MDFVHNGDVNVKPAADLMYIIPMEIGNYSYGIRKLFLWKSEIIPME